MTEREITPEEQVEFKDKDGKKRWGFIVGYTDKGIIIREGKTGHGYHVRPVELKKRKKKAKKEH